jgi:hypothetical protein
MEHGCSPSLVEEQAQMYALHFVFVDDCDLEQELVAVSTSIDTLMAHASADAFGKGAKLTDFEPVGSCHIAYVVLGDSYRAKYFIEPVLVV